MQDNQPALRNSRCRGNIRLPLSAAEGTLYPGLCSNLKIGRVDMKRPPIIDMSSHFELLSGEREERYAFERNISLSVLCSWLYVLDDVDTLKHAQTVASANIYRSCKDSRRTTIPITIDILSDALADPPIASDFFSVVCRARSRRLRTQ